MILDFEKPKKIRSTEEHNEMHSSDSGVAGTFVPNMSEEDKNKWKGKHIKGDDERVEIRKNLDSQLLVIVYKKPHQPDYPVFPEFDGGSRSGYWEEANKQYSAQHRNWEKRHQNIRISMNGPCQLTLQDWADLQQAILEAQDQIKYADMRKFINFDKEWLINKFHEISEEWGNGESIEDVEFKMDRDDRILITFTLECGRYGTHKHNSIRITKGGVSLSLAEIIEGGDIEAELEDAIIEKINSNEQV
jgi:hypothetical protein